MAKKIIITERQLHLIKEALNNNFDFDELSSIPSFSGRMKYCNENLGKYIGRGSSRLVYQYTDYQVLKLAMNEKGMAQNEHEGQDDWYKKNYSIFPEVYAKSDNFSWLLSEYVLPAKNEDFKRCIGMNFNDWVKYVEKIEKNLRPRRYHIFYSNGVTDEMLSALIENNEFVNEFYDYFANYDETLGDMYNIKNYGLAVRGGQPWLVILDSGLSDDIFSKYYRG